MPQLGELPPWFLMNFIIAMAWLFDPFLWHKLKGETMAQELNPNDIVDFRELVMANTIQVYSAQIN
ncbi:uncharacterized protein Dvar_46490 [Desulfosarcina variabilis str. Montpellier]|uniref:hypothetical protein n=1 Tax=Desulfosarcina variabilis TaxID=2300 RepID=UPI003AFA3CA7